MDGRRRHRIWLLALAALAVATGAARAQPSTGGELRVAVDADLQRSGLPDRLLPGYQERRGVRVSLRGLPSKTALELGAAGQVDAVWVHAPRLEVLYLNQGFYLDRRLVMYTDYVLAGPPADPAGVRGSRRAAAAFREIARRQAPFVSGGKQTAAYGLEQELWTRARVVPAPPWYRLEDAGAAGAVASAAATGGYVLAERSALASALEAGRLEVVVDGVRPLRSGYYVMDVNPHRFATVNHAEARAFGDYLLSPAAQEAIRAFGTERAGRPVFFSGVGASDAVR
jgi:tungstate transport system substrate-binding protein